MKIKSSSPVALLFVDAPCVRAGCLKLHATAAAAITTTTTTRSTRYPA